MRLTRCFSPEPLQAGSVITLPPIAAAHVMRVLRLRPGAALTLFDGRGGQHPARLLGGGPAGVRVEVGERQAVERESPVQLRLLQGLARGERMDWIVQKATELGVAAIVPFHGEHSVVRLQEPAASRRVAHWRAVAISACEQCGRNRLPAIAAIADLPTALAAAPEPTPGRVDQLRLLLCPDARQSLPARLASLPPSCTISVLVGPEGGLSDSEQEAARRDGFQAVRLGPRVLRAETAPLAALASIQALVGDFI